jgi:hypothetical protein
MRVQRHASGSVRYDKRRKTWNYLWYDGPTRRSRRIGTKQEFPTKAAAWQEVENLKTQAKQQDGDKGDTVRSVIARYEAERMPSRQSTARVYRSFLNNHVLPKWGDTRIQDVQPRPVELWLRELPLSPKSKTHVRSLMHGLVGNAEGAESPEPHGGAVPRPAERAARAVRNYGPALCVFGPSH